MLQTMTFIHALVKFLNKSLYVHGTLHNARPMQADRA